MRKLLWAIVIVLVCFILAFSGYLILLGSYYETEVVLGLVSFLVFVLVIVGLVWCLYRLWNTHGERLAALGRTGAAAARTKLSALRNREAAPALEQLRVKRLRPGATLPSWATAGSAGYDLCACLDEPVVIPARGRAMIPTGLAIAIGDPGVVALVFGRSGLGSKLGITPANSVGVVDSDYRGELMLALANHGDEDYTVSHGERLAQMVLMPVFTPDILECDELDDTERGTGGFGSTGR